MTPTELTSGTAIMAPSAVSARGSARAGTAGKPWRLAATGALVAILALLPWAGSAEEIKVESLASRPGVTLPVLILKADRPAASVVLFAGGDGKLGGFQPNGTPVLGGNFLVRSRTVS